MEHLTQPHWEALTLATREAFQHVAQLRFIQRFYLAGGTGLALHLGHRFSIDLDFFSQEPDSVGPDERAELRERLDDPTLAITYDKESTAETPGGFLGRNIESKPSLAEKKTRQVY